jgi:diguanylate cyclase (GGDEF)-like protein
MATHARTFDDDQTRRLLDVHRHVDGGRAARELLRRLTADLANIARATVALVERRDGSWTTLAVSSGRPPLPPAGDSAWRELARLSASLGRSVLVWRAGETEWTAIGLRARPEGAVLLLFEGDWTGSGEALLHLARNLSVAERVAALATQTELALATHRLTRLLGRVSGEQRVCELVLRYLVRAVPSRLAAFAVPVNDDELAILATHGYARALVDHVRVRRGDGVLGTVFQSRTPLRVHDTAVSLGTARSRARYRTRSFLVLPVMAGHDLVGVVSLTDRADDGPYRKDDMAVLRAMLAPVSLALGRERQRREVETLAQAAATDPGSGLFNRRYFHARLEEELQRAARTGAPLGLLMLDIDDFKPINDRYGHVAGDLVIAALADILRRSVRIFDVCARYGGEEFAVLLPNNPFEHAAATAERIRQRVEAHRFLDPHLHDLRVTISIGLAMASDTASARDLVDRADQALYAAKRAGKNRVVGY